MAYDKHTWNTKEAITKSKMQHIEDGIKAASSKADTNETNITTLDSKVGNIDVNNGGSISQRLSSMSGDIQTLKNTNVGALSTRLESVENQVNAARGDTEPRPNLAQVLADMRSETARVEREYKSADTTINSNITTAQNTADAAISALNLAKGNSESVADRIAAIETVNRTQDTDIATLKGRMNTPITGDTKSVEQHLSSLRTDVNTIQSEIETARGVDNLNVARQNLNARFVDEETRLSNAEGRLATLETSTGTTIPNRIGAVEGRVSTAEGKITNIESELTSAKDTYDSIDARFDTVEATANAAAKASEVNTALSGIDARLDALDGGSIADTDDSGSLTGRVAELEVALNYTPTSDEDTTPAGLTQRISVAESNIGTINTTLSEKANTTDVNAALAGKVSTETMNTAITNAVKDISTTIIKNKNEVTYTDNVPSNTQTWTISDKDDYLLQAVDDKYYYWKHIDNAWHLMGGAGNSESGGGNTSGMDLTRVQYNNLLSDQKVENTDYYVRESDGLVHHYRYVMIGNTLTEIEIGPLASNIKRYNLSYDKQKQVIDNVETEVNYLYLHEFTYGEDNDEPTSDTIITSIPLPSGGSGTVISSQKITRITSRTITQPLGSDNPVIVQFFYTSGVAGDGAIGQMYLDDTVIIDNISITSGDPSDASTSWPSGNTVPDGFYSVDLSSYCTTLGTKHFRIVITDIDEPTLWKDMKWDVDVMNLTLSSDFTEHSINNLGSTVKFTYIANGDIDKVANFQLNDAVLPTVNLSKDTDGQTQSYTIPAQSNAGTYRLKVWLTATANGRVLPPSEPIYRDLIWRDSTSSDVIIACKYRDNVNEPMTQYDILEIPYTIVGGTTPYIVNYYVDNMNEAINQVTLTGNAGVWKYHANQEGSHTLKIKCQEQEISFTIDVKQSEKDISPVTDSLVLDFNPQGMSNISNRRLWTNGTYSMTVSNNFDWYNGGYGSDDSGDYFLIKAGTRAVFDYKMFISAEVENSIVNSVFETGKEFKIIFKTNAVRNADAIWFTNMGPSSSSENAKQVGIQLNAHNGFLKTNAASNVAVNGVEATNTYLYFPYSEEDKIELDININQASENNNFIMSYEDGCPSKAYPYSTSEILYHVSGQEANITIGSDDCDVYIYRMRIYDAELSTEDVLRNFIADGKDSAESIERYNRNSIYYDTKKKEFVPYIGTNTVLDPERLATKIPDVKVLMLETPKFTENKKDFVPYSSLRCIHAPGGKYFKSRGKEDNWLFQNGYHAGQGTTSDKYGNAARNLDFLFMCDGIHNPSDKVSVKNENFLPGYQSSLILGYGTDEQEDPTYCLDWKDQDTWAPNTAYTLTDNGHDTLVRYNGQVYKCIEAHTSDSTFDSDKWEVQEGYTSKVTLTSTSIPNNFFNLKVNIASSENANNMLLQKRYNDFLPYVSPAKLRDARIKNGMEFVPAIIFIKETGSAVVNGETITYTRQAFNDSEWHFYALGNIGDSKKTDYTRAYDPDDMNEFTLEISDNNTNNSQFQSGVYMASFYRIVSSPVIDDIGDYYELTNNGKFGEVQYNNETQYYGNFIKTPDTELNNEKTYYIFIEKRRFIEPYTVEEDFDDKGKSKGTYTARSNAGEAIQPISYLFPIDYATEWAALNNDNKPINMRYWSLTKEKFDGDHSFEMRYACQGNYRDGKLVNDTHGKITVNGEQVSKDKYQVETINTEVWRAFYTWLITSTDEQFVNELEEWCVKSAVAFFYAFTHYYTMMDNRAKNTFWHFAKTGKYRRVSRPVEALLHVYEEAQGTVTEDPQYAGVWNGTFAPTADTSINFQKTYYTQYAFDMWIYDTDTALGIDNNGELVFPYGKEDEDFRIDGDPSSSYVFNGAGSIFWRRLRDNFTEAIRSIFTGNRMNECFNADTLIEEFDKYQSCFPEAIWRLDVERKYIRSFTGDTENGTAITTKETRFLRDMMQGRKKYQRRQWAKDQDIYFGSKYMLPIVGNDFFEFSCYNPGGQAVTPNWDLTITPYQDMYINISYAETFASPFRAKAGVMYEFKSILNDMNDSRIRVFGANHIQMLAGKAKREDPDDPEKITGAEGLASFYIKANNFEHGKKLRKLILGSDNINYVNGNFTTFNHANNYPILEELNLKNCGNLGGALDLSQSTALKIIEAQGTQISQVLLPGSTGITTLHLPETITKLELKSAKQLTDLTINDRAGVQNLASLTQLDIDDSDYSNTINWLTLASTALNHLDLVSLLNLSTSSIVNINELEAFKLRKDTINRVYLSGTINVTGSWSTVEVSEYKSVWNNNINFVTNPANMVTRYKITYKYDDYIDDNGNVVEGDEIATKYVRSGTRIPDIVYTNEIEPPTRASTVRYDFTFGVVNYDNYVENSGWKAVGSDTPFNEMPLASGNMTVETYFTPSTRRYPVKWYMRRDDDSTLVKTSSNQEEYGAGYDLEAPTVQEIHNAGQPTIDINVSDDGVATYSIFEGWETLPTNIHPAATDTSYNIYAKWSTPVSLALSEIFADTTNLTPEQLLVYSHTSSSNRNLYVDTTKIGEGKRITVTMGHDSSEEGTTLVASDSILRLDLNPRATKTNIQPMTAENDAFTIMVDYNLSANANYDSSKTAAILMSCYYQNSNENIVSGFAIYDSLKGSAIGPRVGFGDMFSNTSYSVPIGGKSLYHDVRNVIVLRHPAGSEKLYIYSGLNTNNKITSNIEVQTITWNNSTNNAYINFGQLTDSTDPEYDNLKDNLTTARGIIYQAKYWNQDLGVGECKRLASWPHETITFGISKINNNASSGSPGDNNPSPSLCLNTLTGTNYGHLTEDTSSMSWGESTYRTILNTHVVQGLPIKLQAILNKPKVKYLPLVTTTDPVSQAQTTTLSENTLSQNDYLFFPSVYNISSANNTYESETSNMSYEKSPYPWIRSSNVTVYDYNPTATNGHWDISTTDSNTMRYMNLRFSIKPIGQTIRVFRETTNSFSTGNTATIYNEILTVVSSIAVGDIFIDITGHAYMYIANTDINNLGAQVQPNSGIFACPASPGGGWISSSGFATRSMMTPDSWSTNNKHFIYSNESGTVVTAYSSNNSISGNIGLGLNYSFTI